MLNFEIIKELQPNKEILIAIKDFSYKIKNGKIKHLQMTNLKFIEPTKYLITYPKTLTILEYKVSEINNKPFYIKEHNEKYSLREIIKILKKCKNF